jgi:hypothetical protein
MINKENKDKTTPALPKESGFVDVVPVDVQCRILIRDKDTREILVNKRG